MTDEQKIEEALKIALRARIQSPNPIVKWEEIDRLRVLLSADVTAHSRHEGLLTRDQYIIYAGRTVLLIPGAFQDSNGELRLLRRLADGQLDRDLVDAIPQDEDLRKEFIRRREAKEVPFFENPPSQVPPEWKSPF